MSSAVAEIQQDLQKERRSRGGGGSDAAFDEAEVCLVSRFMDFTHPGLAFFCSQTMYVPSTLLDLFFLWLFREVFW